MKVTTSIGQTPSPVVPPTYSWDHISKTIGIWQRATSDKGSRFITLETSDEKSTLFVSGDTCTLAAPKLWAKTWFIPATKPITIKFEPES